MDKKLRVEERAEIVSRNEVWKSVAQRPDLSPCSLFSLGLRKKNWFINKRPNT